MMLKARFPVCFGWRAQMRFAAFALGWWVVSAGPLFGQDVVRIIGSDTMLILNERLSAAYTKANPKAKVQVTGGGSGRGIAALLDGKTDIAAASRPMNEKEVSAFTTLHGRLPWRVAVALDGLAIFVHESNSVGRLSLDQLGDIFSGKLTRWTQVRGLDLPIDLFTRDEQSGTREFFANHVLMGRPFAKAATVVATTAGMHDRVSGNYAGIGYGGVAYAPGMRIVRVAASANDEALWPSAENVASAKYPLTRELIFYLNPSTVSPAMKDFLRFALGKPGQEVVEAVGYYPIGIATGKRDSETVTLTPASMNEHGFTVSVTTGGATSGSDPAPWLAGQIGVRVGIVPAGAETDRVASAALRVGDFVEVPLNVERESGTGAIRAVGFNLKRELFSQATVLLAVQLANGETATREIVLREFEAAR